MARNQLPKRSRTSLGSLLFLLLFLIAVAFGTVKIFPQIQKSRFGQAERFNIILATSPVILVSINIRQKTAVEISFPDDLYLPELIHGYGRYRAGAIFAAGELDKRGGETLAGSVQEFLGVPVDGYFRPEGKETNLSLLDLVRFYWTFKTTRFDKVKKIDLEKLASPLILADGSMAKSVDAAELDNFLNGAFTEDNLREENWRVEVVNTTNINGLGARAGRLLTNLGLTVVNVDSVKTPVGACEVRAKEKARQSPTARRLAKIFGCGQVLSGGQDNRADVSLFLGADYVRWLTQ